ncbi:MAG: cob(I)yrinic acid a,c-diamide adenosyltransferase [Eudoraea sp.]|nr:cob(I)yrinic acid a,c-diamide adenosyltransferase [Eudoraea sp.]MBT8311534.1 cob(I)yrinic acid a,c-diamide adenosyltransferase [Eudoraea sp.]MBT8322687.1 cob(I)yrinic acid a,c-diamide adenosyltransferase [Eudoraea sp.]NNJ37935.1 cob(I)yrinic acid a,c-diamide adenosyltransferase [Flavobacteriaceae bacterium]NNJ41517.1 cob(I)yrinic acid a,c-diamide adenosyltransferase [Eudoraea sp.]
MKIYTKTGDTGTTSLFGGTRVPKHHIRIESYGTIDELNSWIGLLRDLAPEENTRDKLKHIQDRLFVLGAHLATEPAKAKLKSGKDRLNIDMVKKQDVEQLERAMDQMNEQLAPMTHFILPGGHTTVSYCHIARTICRRAERMITYLHENDPVNPLILTYINRLSDYLFVLARKLSADLQAEEIKWIPEKKD